MKKNNYAILVNVQKELKFVTKMEGSYAEWNDGENAMLMTKTMAEMIATCLSINGYPALVAIIPDSVTKIGNF